MELMKKQDKREKNIISLWKAMVKITLLLPVLLLTVMTANAEPQKKVRVGFYQLDGYHMQEENGKRSGYGYVFLQKIGRYLPYSYEYVGYDKSWKEMLEMLENGEIDILTSGGKTPERESRFEYSGNAIGTTVTMLSVKTGNDCFVSGDFTTYEGAKLGFLKNSFRNERFQSYAEEKGFTYLPVYYDTYAEMEQDLQDGVIDGIVSSNLRKIGNEWILEQFDHNDFYVLAPKGEREILDEIDRAIENLDRDEPGWRTNLMYKSYTDPDKENISLTSEEKMYLDGLKESQTVLKVLVNPDRSPYSYFKEGEAVGIIPAIFESAAASIDLPYEVVETKSREEYYHKLEAGEADICMDAGFDYSRAEEIGYELTEAYMSTGFSRITRKGFTGEMETIASMEKPFLLRDYLEERFANLKIRYYSSIEECVHAVETGEADATFLYTYTVQEIMNQDFRNKFSAVIMGGGYTSFAIGVRGDSDPCLLTALNKAVESIRNNEIESIILKKTEHLQSDESLAGFLYKNPFYGMMIIAVLGALAAATGIIITGRRSQKRLKLAYEEAERANHAKQDFLSKMSHDIRTPMNAIMGMTDIAQRHASDERMVREYLAKMKVSEDYLLTLIDEVLDMSRIESSVIELNRQVVSIPEMMEEVSAMMHQISDPKEQELVVDVQNIRHTRVVGDARRMEQILVNLLSNAIKYTGRGGKILLQVSEEEDGKYRFLVKDNGMGIPEDFKKHIFEAFARAEDSRISRVQGTGLGLTIVKNFTESMGGTISFESWEGKGTEFCVFLPLKIAGEECAVPEQETAPEGQEQEALTGLRVLLVEDNELNREIAQELLECMGVAVDCAENGKEGVRRFLDSDIGFYDAVLMDLQMPVMNGLDACREIRVCGRKDADLPVFALTANAHEEDIRNSREAGMDTHISKPIDVTKLYSLLKEVYDRSI